MKAAEYSRLYGKVASNRLVDVKTAQRMSISRPPLEVYVEETMAIGS